MSLSWNEQDPWDIFLKTNNSRFFQNIPIKYYSGLQQMESTETVKCPYLSTIKRHLLDFDFQRVCSVSLASTNIYGCLVCGRYFQGRVSSSPAYEHSIEYNHYLFINLQTSKVYCLPDNYEVNDHTLADIKCNLNPEFAEETIQKLAEITGQYNVDGKQFIPGTVGLNNLSKTDFLNCVVQLLNTVEPIRRQLLPREQKTWLNDKESSLVDKVSFLLKKMWNPQSFKGAASPHELMQAITEKSNKSFKIGKAGDPAKLIVWLIDNLSRELKKQKSKFKVRNLFEGTLKTSFLKRVQTSAEFQEIPTKVQQKTFIVLNLSFPEKGIFNKIKSEVSVKTLLQIYSGTKGQTVNDGIRYIKVTNFPKYLILVFKRFIDNGYIVEKDSSQLNYNEQLQVTPGKRYTLISQICHEGSVAAGAYRAYIRRNAQWFSILDLEVTEIPTKQMLLGQPYIQLYQSAN